MNIIPTSKTYLSKRISEDNFEYSDDIFNDIWNQKWTDEQDKLDILMDYLKIKMCSKRTTIFGNILRQ